jgi:hypothetical protein
MKHLTGRIAASAIFILLFVPSGNVVIQAQDTSSGPESMSIWQARRTLVASSETAIYVTFAHTFKIDVRSFRFSGDTIEFDTVPSKTGSHHLTIDLRLIQGVSVKCGAICVIRGAAGRDLPSSFPHLSWIDDRHGLLAPTTCAGECTRQAKSFTVALNRLNAFAGQTDSPLRAFAQQATAWRALAAKPPLPEEIRARRMLAEDAIRNHKAEEALKHYELALEQYPTWPQGWFNAALIAGELGYYAEAVESMQAYLDLVPDASDAQSARDQLGIWRYKAGEHKLESNETR